MMGHQGPPQPSLFRAGIDLEKRVRADHVLRRVARMADFDFLSSAASGGYGYNGSVSPALKTGVILFYLLDKPSTGSPTLRT